MYYVLTYYGFAIAAGGEGLAASIVAVTGGAHFYEQDRRCIPSPCLLLNDVEQCGQTICAAAASSPASFLVIWAALVVFFRPSMLCSGHIVYFRCSVLHRMNDISN